MVLHSAAWTNRRLAAERVSSTSRRPVEAYFNDAQRQSTKDAGTISGMSLATALEVTALQAYKQASNL